MHRSVYRVSIATTFDMQMRGLFTNRAKIWRLPTGDALIWCVAWWKYEFVLLR
jgi:hypothetical protein